MSKMKRKILSLLMTAAMITMLFAGLTISSSAYTAAPSVTIKLSECDEGLKIVTTTSVETGFNGQSAAWFGYIELPEGCITLGEEEIYEYDSTSYYWCIEKQEDKYFVEADYGINDFEFVLPLSGEVVGNVKLEITDIRVNGQRNIACNEDSILSLVLGSSSGGDNIAISDSAITNSTGSAAATVTGTVTDGTATLNVACDKACTVAYTTDDGATYTCVSAVQADSGYNFVVPDYSENMKFVVAVKGDVSGDGKITAADYGALVAAYLGTGSLDNLNTIIGDINADNKITAADYGALVAAYLGTGTIAW